jgi:hypothetical protein
MGSSSSRLGVNELTTFMRRGMEFSSSTVSISAKWADWCCAKEADRAGLGRGIEGGSVGAGFAGGISREKGFSFLCAGGVGGVGGSVEWCGGDGGRGIWLANGDEEGEPNFRSPCAIYDGGGERSLGAHLEKVLSHPRDVRSDFFEFLDFLELEDGLLARSASRFEMI